MKSDNEREREREIDFHFSIVSIRKHCIALLLNSGNKSFEAIKRAQDCKRGKVSTNSKTIVNLIAMKTKNKTDSNLLTLNAT